MNQKICFDSYTHTIPRLRHTHTNLTHIQTTKHSLPNTHTQLTHTHTHWGQWLVSVCMCLWGECPFCMCVCMCVCVCERELCVSCVSGSCVWEVFSSECVVVCMCVKFVCVWVCVWCEGVSYVCEVSVRSCENPGGSMKVFLGPWKLFWVPENVLDPWKCFRSLKMC